MLPVKFLFKIDSETFTVSCFFKKNSKKCLKYILRWEDFQALQGRHRRKKVYVWGGGGQSQNPGNRYPRPAKVSKVLAVSQNQVSHICESGP